MPEQRYFTIFDLLSESIFLLSIIMGCYLGTQVKESFFTLLLGGIVGYVICRFLGLLLYLLFKPPTSSD